MLYGTLYLHSFCIFFNLAITIGFEQEFYTVFEAFNATGELIEVPIIKSNNQTSNETFEVIVSVIAGSSSNAATDGTDYFSGRNVSSFSFRPDQQRINYQFELIDDDTPEGEEVFQLELSLGSGTPGVSVGGGGVYSRATVVIIDDDG